MSNIVSTDATTGFSLLKVLKLLTKYYKPATEGDHFKTLKKFIFHTNPLIAKEFIDIMRECKSIDILTLNRDEEEKKIKEPSSKQLQENFQKFCTFLDDSCFDEYSSAEIGESFARVLICCNDVTVFNFRLYGTFLTQYQQKKSKKKRAGKNSLPEIFMYMLKHA